MERIFGIDLGTTNSLIAYMDGDTPRVIADPVDGPLLPSIVSFGAGGEVRVGRAAREQAALHPLETVASVKRFMGLGTAQVSDEDRLHYAFSPTERTGIVRFRIHARDYTSPEISAVILKALKERAERTLGETVHRVVITVPAYFNDSQRQATRDAGRLAGLDVLRLLNEPTAASLAYGLNRREHAIIAVYDLGGGTFDLSLLKLQEGIFQVLATSGDTRLGGDDMDHRLADLLLADVPPALRDDPVVRRSALMAAEEAKHRLTEADETKLTLSVNEHNLDVTRALTREGFEAAIADIVERSLAPCRQALKDAGLAASDIDEVVLVGGATRVPLVRRRVAELFGRVPHTELNPEEVVALGAAVQAGVLSGQRQDMLLLDVVPLSLGIETVGGVMERLIERNTTIPVIARQTFTTFVDNQTAVDFHVLQGERELAQDNRSLARFKLSGIVPQPAGLPRVDVTFMIDANGILNVTAADQYTAREQSVEVKPSYGLSEEEIERMLEESFDHAEEDVSARLIILARNDADGILRATRKALDSATAEERAMLEAVMGRLEEAMRGNDHNQVRDLIEELNTASTPLAQRIMDSSIQQALSARRVTEFS